MAEDLDDTKKSLAEDKKFLADMDKNCKTKKEEYQVVKKSRAEELVALADTIRILNDDDALDLFKKTLPTPALLQTTVSSQQVRQQALRALKKKGKDARLDLIALALRGRKVSFDKVIAMIDDMVVLLGKEQKDDDDKKAYCLAELDKAEDELKVLDQTVEDLGKRIDDIKEGIATLTEEIAALVKGIKDLDKAVEEATADRKEEHEEFERNLADDTAALQILGIAKNRLNKFYNPKLYKPVAKRELTESERITVNMGGTLAPTNAPGGIAGTGVTAFVQHATDSMVAPPPPPEAVKAYQKKGQESAAVTQMITLLETDLEKEISTLKVDEKNAQEEYEQFMQDSAAKRAADSQSIQEKEGAKADLEADLEKTKTEKKAKTAEAMDKAEQLRDLHLECDWLLANFDARKEARAGEVEAMTRCVESSAEELSRERTKSRHLGCELDEARAQALATGADAEELRGRMSDLERESVRLRDTVESLEQALHSAEMKEVNLDEQERTMKKLIFANKQLREDLSQEIERYNLLEEKFRDLLVKFNLVNKQNEKNQQLVFTMGTGANLPRYDNFLDEGDHFTSSNKKK